MQVYLIHLNVPHLLPEDGTKAISNWVPSQQLLIALLSCQAWFCVLPYLSVLLISISYLILSFASFILCSTLSFDCIFLCLDYSFVVTCRYKSSFPLIFFAMPFWYLDLQWASDTVVTFSCRAAYLSSALGHFVIISLTKFLSVVPILKEYTFICWNIFLTKFSSQFFSLFLLKPIDPYFLAFILS